MEKICFLNYETVIDDSWANFVTDGFITQELRKIEDKIASTKQDYTPPNSKILRFLNFDLKKCMYVILGQDPYPQQGKATGRAFEVGNVTSWEEKSINTSLQNILKLLHKNQTCNESIQSLKIVRQDIRNGKFNIAPPNKLFENWERQGVLLLNTALTTKIDSPKSHSNFWSTFVKNVINYINQNFPNVIWLLWGKEAQRFGLDISRSNKRECSHPRLNKYGKGSFYYENHFKNAGNVNWWC